MKREVFQIAVDFYEWNSRAGSIDFYFVVKTACGKTKSRRDRFEDWKTFEDELKSWNISTGAWALWLMRCVQWIRWSSGKVSDGKIFAEMNRSSEVLEQDSNVNKKRVKNVNRFPKQQCFGFFCGFVRRSSFDQNASNATRQHQRKNADTINSLIISSVLL
jgi:hypothetical protein